MSTIYINTLKFTGWLCVHGADLYYFVHRHVLTGSYNNNFHIYDKNAETDIVLQADKSAFKAKKVGGQKNKGMNNKGGAKGGNNNNSNNNANGVKTPIDVDNIDYNKKILHASWHPREDTIAVSFYIHIDLIEPLFLWHFIYTSPGVQRHVF